MIPAFVSVEGQTTVRGASCLGAQPGWAHCSNPVIDASKEIVSVPAAVWSRSQSSKCVQCGEPNFVPPPCSLIDFVTSISDVRPPDQPVSTLTSSWIRNPPSTSRLGSPAASGARAPEASSHSLPGSASEQFERSVEGGIAAVGQVFLRKNRRFDIRRHTRPFKTLAVLGAVCLI